MWQTLHNIIAIALRWYACTTTFTTGIPPHIDTHSPFEDGIISLSLQSQVCPLGTSIFHVECYIQVWALCVASFPGSLPLKLHTWCMYTCTAWSPRPCIIAPLEGWQPGCTVVFCVRDLLNSQVVMDFRHPDGRKVPVYLPRRSLLVMKGESRYLWSHGLAPNYWVILY